jgi:hypothetical protein
MSCYTTNTYLPGLVKIIFGTILFVFILRLADGKNTTMAGMMLTFPALNGIGLLFAQSQDLQRMTRSMIPMIALNGILCAGYIISHRSLVPWIGTISGRQNTAGWILSIGSLFIWVVVAFILNPYFKQWKPSPLTLVFVGSVVLLLLFLMTRGLLWSDGAGNPLSKRKDLREFLGAKANIVKIALMALLIAVVLYLTRMGKDVWAGMLSAFPLLPLFSLLMIPYDEHDRCERVRKLDRLGRTVLFGPIVAMSFAASFAYILSCLKSLASSGWTYWGLGILILILLWSGCGLLIWMVCTLRDRH